jgi:hypothetical protein
MMSRRKSRRLSSSYHVRLSGWKPPSLWRSPLSPSALHHLKQKPHSSLNSLSVRSDETLWANPRPRLPGWIIFAPEVSSRNKLPSLTETLAPWAILDSFGCLAGGEGYWPKRKIRKVEKESVAPGISLSNLSHSHFLFLGIRKAWFQIPQTVAMPRRACRREGGEWGIGGWRGGEGGARGEGGGDMIWGRGCGCARDRRGWEILRNGGRVSNLNESCLHSWLLDPEINSERDEVAGGVLCRRHKWAGWWTIALRDGVWHITKPFSIYVYFNIIIRVNVLKSY